MKGKNVPIIVCKKSTVVKIAMVSLAVIALIIAVSLNVPAVLVQAITRKLPVYCVDSQEKTVCLTFDAAWGADKTQGILDILAENDVRATFFLVGFWVDNFPEMVQKISDAGHEIGTHSEKHPHMSQLSRAEMANELTSSSEKISAITNQPVKIFRPPFGDYNNALIEVCENLDIMAIQWDVDSLDWKGLNAAAIHERVVTKAKAGSIVLFHNNSDHILKALPLVIQTLKLKGFSFSAVSDIVLRENYTIDHSGMQHKA